MAADCGKFRKQEHAGKVAKAAVTSKFAGYTEGATSPSWQQQSLVYLESVWGWLVSVGTGLSRGTQCVSFEQAPIYLKCNAFVTGGYRARVRGKQVSGLSSSECVASILHVHNETGNIWTHMVPAFIYAVVIARYLSVEDWEGKWAFVAFALGSLACFFFSTLYHVFNAHSFHAWDMLLNLDYLGIACGFLGTALSSTYLLMYCFPTLMWRYQAAVIGVGILTIIGFNSPLNRESNPNAIIFRGVTMSTLSFIMALPTLHHRWITGSFYFEEKAFYWSRMPWLALIIVVCAIVYVMQLPERWWPGRFNTWLHSHQLMHIFVAVANALVYWVNWDYLEFRVNTPCDVVG